MKKIITIAMISAALAFIVAPVNASPPVSAKADRVREAAPDPSKKKTGEECKSTDECQRHHTCKPDGEKNVCTAHPRPKYPVDVKT